MDGEGGDTTSLSRPQIRHEDRYQSYKTLIHDIAERLSPEDVHSISFNQDLPELHSQPATALEVLQQLERHGLFSDTKIQPLSVLLNHIHRNDLVNKYVEPFQTRYGRHLSMPESASPNMAVRMNRPHSFPSRKIECINEETPRQPIQETREYSPQASSVSYGMPHMQETSSNSQQDKYRRPAHTHSTEMHFRPLMPHQHAPQFNNHSYTHVRATDEEAQPFPQPLTHSRSLSSEQASSQRTSTLAPIPQHYATPFYLESNPIRIPPNTELIPNTEVPQPQDVFSPLQPMQEFVYVDSELPSHNSSQNASQSDQFGYSSSLSGPLEMTPENSSSWHTRASPSTEQRHATHLPPPNEEVHPGQHCESYPQGQHFQRYAGSALKRPTSHQTLPGIPSSYEGTQRPRLARVQTDGQIYRSSTPTLSTGNRRTSAPASYLRRSTGSVNRITPHRAPGFYTPQHVYRTRHASASSMAASDNGIEIQSLRSPSRHSGIGIQPESVSANSPSWTRIRQHTDSRTDALPPHQEMVDVLGSRIGQLNVSHVAKGGDTASERFDREQSPVSSGKLRSGSSPKKFKHRRKSWGAKTQDIQWALKRNDLNKIVYEHKTKKYLTSPDKLELGYPEAKNSPKLIFKLYPYGLEADFGKNATLEVEIKIPTRKCPRLPSSAKVSLTVSAWDCKEKLCLNSETVERPMNLRQFTIPKFITHVALKESHSDYIEIQASAELIVESQI